MKTKVLAPVLFIAGLLASTLTASAQIKEVTAQNNNHTAESLVMGMTAYSSGTFVAFACNWSSPASPASLSTGGTMSCGPNDGYNFSSGFPALDCSFMVPNASNASGRGVIRGKNNNGGTTPSSVTFTCRSTNDVQIVIWGPTLNGFGLTGATHFTWNVTCGSYSNSNSGEATFTIPQSYTASNQIFVTITPSNDNELGSVMANFNN